MNKLINKVVKLLVVAKYIKRLEQYKHLINSRKTLSKLDDNMLKDIGLTRAEAEKEAAKPFWKSEPNDSVIKKSNTPLNKAQYLIKMHSKT